MRTVTIKAPGNDGTTDACSAVESEETKQFMQELLALCKKHGLALVPQNDEYEVSFHSPMRAVPLVPAVEEKLNCSWVVFEED